MAEIRTIAVIGAGAMGRSIACATALAGYRTILEDILSASLRRTEAELRAGLDDDVRLNRITSQDAEAALSRLEYASTVKEAARQADLVIEAVPEELESKIEIFTLLDKICRPNTILVSSTSTLSLEDMASVTYRAARCVGMRFTNPVHQMKILELVSTPQTDEETLAACAEVGRRIVTTTMMVE